jgi:hypothetical protein
MIPSRQIGIKMFSLLPFLALAGAREIVFPPTSGYTTADQAVLGSGYNDPDISQAKFAGMNTYANLPYVHCLAREGEEVERFDIAVLGAPFDTVSSLLLCVLCCGYMLPSCTKVWVELLLHAMPLQNRIMV